jgi:hypothetical protein
MPMTRDLVGYPEFDELDIVQNPAVGAFALWSYTHQFYVSTQAAAGPTLPMLMVVLPMVFHEDTLRSIKARHLNGGLHLAIAEDRTLPIGLQERMVSTAPITLRSLNLALAAGLVGFDREAGEFFPLKRTLPPVGVGSDTSELCKGAKRLGHWFSTLSLQQVMNLLQVRF